jgi:excisionase family DNA binding protein
MPMYIPPEQIFPIAMTIADVTRRTGIGRTSVFEAIRVGKLRAVKVGARTLIRAEDLTSFLDSLPDARAGKAA